MKLIRTCLIISLLPFCLFSQPSIEWETSVGSSADDAANSIIQTSDGGYVVAGTIGSFYLGVAKLDMFGVVEWQNSYMSSANAFSVIEVASGGYLIGGVGGPGIPGYHGLQDVILIKINAIGILEWAKCYGGSNDERAEEIIQNSSGNFVVVGDTRSNDGDVSGNNGFGDLWVFEVDSAGNILWQKALGGSWVEGGRSIAQTWDGGYIITGYSSSSDGDLSQNYGSSDTWVVKTDSIGNIEWSKNYGGSNFEMGNSIIPAPSGGYIFAGHTQSDDYDVDSLNGFVDVWVVRLDNSGNIIWETCYGGTGEEIGCKVKSVGYSDYVVAGLTSSSTYSYNGFDDYWIVKLNAYGGIWWEQNFGGSNIDRAYGMDITNDGGYVICGYSESNDLDVSSNLGGRDMWIVKLGSEAGLPENEIGKNTDVWKIVDLMGRETEFKPNTPLIYIYSDGSTEKVFTFE